jgi:hypothetical protein
MNAVIPVAMLVSLIAVQGASTSPMPAPTSVDLIAGGASHAVRAVKVGGVWYVSAADVARALGKGASFDASSRTLVASGPVAASPSGVAAAGSGSATNGMIAAHLVSVKSATTFDGTSPDPGAHFVLATIQLKNLTDMALPLYQVKTSLVNGSSHVDDGQLYDSTGADPGVGNATPGETITYLVVFEIDDGVAADAILMQAPFASKDILIKL